MPELAGGDALSGHARPLNASAACDRTRLRCPLLVGGVPALPAGRQAVVSAPLDGCPAGFRDVKPSHFNRTPADNDASRLRAHESRLDQLDQGVDGEALRDQRRFYAAVRARGEDREGAQLVGIHGGNGFPLVLRRGPARLAALAGRLQRRRTGSRPCRLPGAYRALPAGPQAVVQSKGRRPKACL